MVWRILKCGFYGINSEEGRVILESINLLFIIPVILMYLFIQIGKNYVRCNAYKEEVFLFNTCWSILQL